MYSRFQTRNQAHITFGVSTTKTRNYLLNLLLADIRLMNQPMLKPVLYSISRIDPTTGLLKHWGRRRGKRSLVARWKRLVLRDICPYCTRRYSNTIDHINPRANGGDNFWENLTGACDQCNRRKGKQSILQFLVERE